ncbi:hypothetical protein TL16_g08489 [Triparma laevis f. inornata]|uniref:FACT complex subunit SSRP1-like first PH domain-containing protein n=1 Tax=Triparma laevis f. inornata TaxID=1714386 RepID=A0A9W7B1B8_9STRA|nr:hypothetical protein TL16_g08489 [Triparma laevis f. inornata]
MLQTFTLLTTLVLALEKAVRQGQQKHSYLVIQVDKNDSTVALNLDEEAKNKSGMKDEKLSGKFSNIMAKAFKLITGKKVFVTGTNKLRYPL